MAKKDKVVKIRINETLHLNALKSPLIKGAILTLEGDKDRLKVVLDNVSDEDVSDDAKDNPLVQILEIEKKKKKKKSKKKKKKKPEKKSDKKKDKKDDKGNK